MTIAEIIALAKLAGGGSDTQSDWNQNDSTAADYVKNRPFYDNSWVLDTSNVLEANDINSTYGFVLVSNNPDDFYLSENINYYAKYNDIEYKVTAERLSDHTKFYYTEDNGKAITMCYIVTQEGAEINISGYGTDIYKISNPSIGIWVKHDPTFSDKKASIYTKDFYKIDPKFLPDSPRSTMIVNITINDDKTYSADKTFDEILEFYNNGGTVCVLCYESLFPLVVINSSVVVFFLSTPADDITIDTLTVSINSNNGVNISQASYSTLPKTIGGDENRFLKGDGTWSELPLSFNDAGELEVTLNGVTKTFVPK